MIYNYWIKIWPLKYEAGEYGEGNTKTNKTVQAEENKKDNVQN